MRPSYNVPPNSGVMGNPTAQVNLISQCVKGIMIGQLNTVLTNDISLMPNSATTIINDARLSVYSHLSFMPLTANAAAAVPALWVSFQNDGTVTLSHANNAQTDRTFRINVIT